MNEMISQTEDVKSGQEVSLDTIDDGFMVGLYLRSKSEFTHKKFDNLDAALELYVRFVKAIVKGEGSYEERKSWLGPDRGPGRVRYYSTQRPLGPGTFPKTQKVLGVVNFDFTRRQYVEAIKREAWGYVEYAAPLTEEEAKQYELVREPD